MTEVTKPKVENVLKSFQKDKILGLHGLPMEFYTHYMEFIGDEFLVVIEYSITTDHILSPFNTTFLTLILKVDNFYSFD